MTAFGTRPRNFEAALASIPVFPLPEVALYPEAVLPLHVFEPRYRVMLGDCLASHGALVIARLLPGEDRFGRPRIATIAGGGLVADHHTLPDGRSNIVVLGQARLRLVELEPSPDTPYRLARATVLEDEDVPVPEAERSALLSAAYGFAGAVKKRDARFVFELPSGANPGRLADVCAFQLLVDPDARQRVLEELDPRRRVGRVTEELALQRGALLRESNGLVLN